MGSRCPDIAQLLEVPEEPVYALLTSDGCSNENQVQLRDRGLHDLPGTRLSSRDLLHKELNAVTLPGRHP